MAGSENSIPELKTVQFIKIGSRVLTYLVLIIFLLTTVVPFLSIAMAGFKAPNELIESAFALPKEFRVSNFVSAWNQAHFSWYFKNSVIVVIPVVTVGAILSIMSGYAFARMKFNFSKLIFALFLVGIMVPQESYIIPLYYLQKSLKLTDTYWGMILPQIAMSVCFGTFWMRGFFASLPKELSDAARVDGCGTWATLWRVLVPNAWAAISTMCVLFFIWTWNDFMIALVNISTDTLRTMPLGLAFFQGRYSSNVPLVSAAATIVSLPTILVYLLFQRQFTRGITSGTIHGT